MADPVFVCETELSGLTPLLIAASPVYMRSDVLHRGIAQRVGQTASNLFGEPVTSVDGASIRWYARWTGEAQPLLSLDSRQRSTAEAELRAQLSVLAPLLQDPTLGSLLRAACHIRSLDDIRLMNGHPLLTNWGLVPHGIADHESELDAHFAATLGRYALFPAPRLGISEARSRAKSAKPVDGATAMMPGGRRSEPAPSWKAPLIAAAVAAALLLWLSWPQVLRSWYGSTYSGAITRARELNNALSVKITEIEKSLEAAVCVSGTLKGPSDLPPGDLNQIKAPGTPTPPNERAPANLGEFIDSAVVLVLVDKGFGSGFFIGPKTIVTNFHVAKDSRNIVVVNKKLGGLTPVTLRAHTPGTEGDDFAVLEIAPDGPSGQAMSLSTVASEMDPANIAGYPGIVVEADAALQKLRNGDLTAIPNISKSRTFIDQLYIDQIPSLIEVTNQIRHGNSGGPLVDMCGRALGVNSMFLLGKDGDRANFALSAKSLMAFLDSAKIPYVKSDDACHPEAVPTRPGPIAAVPQGAPR